MNFTTTRGNMAKVLRLRKRTEDILSAPTSVVFTIGERAQVRAAAKLSDQSVSAFIRAAAVKAAKRTTAKGFAAQEAA
jgi:hypothetical protein